MQVQHAALLHPFCQPAVHALICLIKRITVTIEYELWACAPHPACMTAPCTLPHPGCLATPHLQRLTLGETPVVLDGIRITSKPTAAAQAAHPPPPANATAAAAAAPATAAAGAARAVTGAAAGGPPAGSAAAAVEGFTSAPEEVRAAASWERVELEVDFHWAGEPNGAWE